MERLTERIGDGIAFPSELVGVMLTPDNEVMYALLNRLAAYEDICFNSEGKEIISLAHLKELVQAERDGLLMALPFVAMVEQSLQGGQMKPQCDQRFNGRYAVVYLDKKKWACPLIDICGTPYNSDEAEERQKGLAPKEAQATLAEKEKSHEDISRDKENRGEK